VIIKALIFDIDGTLVDSFQVYHSVFNQGIADFNTGEVPQNVLRRLLAKNLSLREILQRVLPFPIDDAAYHRCREKIIRLYKEAEVEGVRSFPGTERLLRELQDMKIKIGIATGRTSSSDDEWLRFRRLGLDRYISAIVTSREVGYRKPEPDTIIECARRMETPLENCIVVGDTEADIIAAKRAGAVAVGVMSGHESEEALLKANPAVVLKNVGDFLSYVKETGGQA